MPSPPPSGRTIQARPVIAVSLKLYFDVARTQEWCQDVAAIARAQPAVRNGAIDVVVLPSLPALQVAAAALAGTAVQLGAQDLFHEDRGAFTGAVSGTDLHDCGCGYVEVGHVERRTLFGEDDHTVGLKAQAAWRNGLTPILCVGESSRDPIEVSAAQCVKQLDSAIPVDLDKGAPLIVAYEPAWAIGAAQAAGPKHVSGVTRKIRTWLEQNRPQVDARVIYGGSAGVGLLTTLGDAVDGLFLGRFAHQSSALARIFEEAVHLN